METWAGSESGGSGRSAGRETEGAKNTHRALRFRPVHPSNHTYVTYIRPPAYLSDSAYRLIERVVLRRGRAACSIKPAIHGNLSPIHYAHAITKNYTNLGKVAKKKDEGIRPEKPGIGESGV